MKIVLASNNPHKIKEIRAILRRDISDKIELLSLADIGFSAEIAETVATFEENALIKARAVSAYGYPSMADDSGLEVEALQGAPGVHSARYAGEPCNDERNNRKLLAALEGVPKSQRNARFVSVIALVLPEKQKEFTVRGECAGKILTDYKGTAGFGYDPLFLYEPLSKTFGELSAEEKNRISHRARALELFTQLLKKELKE